MVSQGLDDRETVKRYKKALSLAHAQDDKEAKLLALVGLSALLIRRKRLKEAKHRCEQAVALARERRDGFILAQCLRRLGEVFFRMGEGEQALAAYQEAYTLFEQQDKERDLVVVLHEVAVAYEHLGECNKAIGIDEYGEALAQNIGDAELQALHLSHLGLLYLSLNQTEVGVSKMHQSLDLYRMAGDSQGGQVVILLALAKQNLQKKEWLAALPLLEEAYFIAMLVQDESQQQYACWLLRRVAEQVGERDHKIAGPISFDLYDLMAREIDLKTTLASIDRVCNHWFWEKGPEDEEEHQIWQRRKRKVEGQLRILKGILAYEVGGEVFWAYGTHREGLKVARLVGDLRGEGMNLLGLSRALAQPCMWELRGKIIAQWRIGYERLCGRQLDQEAFVSGWGTIPKPRWSRGERQRAWEQSEEYYCALREDKSTWQV